MTAHRSQHILHIDNSIISKNIGKRKNRIGVFNAEIIVNGFTTELKLLPIRNENYSETQLLESFFTIESKTHMAIERYKLRGNDGISLPYYRSYNELIEYAMHTRLTDINLKLFRYNMLRDTVERIPAMFTKDILYKIRL